MIIRIKQIIWDAYINILYLISAIIRYFSKVNPRKVIFIANEGKLYGCNPKYITEELLKGDVEGRYEIVWVLNHPIADHPHIKTVKFHSLAYIWEINTAGFVFNNFRTDAKYYSWKKRKDQKYIMTWHGCLPLKKIEGDANKLNPQSKYMRLVRKDSASCDLMFSSSKFSTGIIRGAMEFSGETMECGCPRNDMFYDDLQIKKAKKKVCEALNISTDLIVLYAPTFRANYDLSCYDIDWNLMIPELKQKYNCDNVVVLKRLHPDLYAILNTHETRDAEIVDASGYEDMQELMCAADILITDYSSTMFEFALMRRPCFLYINDYQTYDRGFYFSFDTLPFPSAVNNQDLAERIRDFDLVEYKNRLEHFMKDEIGLTETGHSAKSVVEWMDSTLKKEL